MRKLLPPLVFLVAVVGTLETLSRRGRLPSYLVPAPSQIWHVLRLEAPTLLPALVDTMSASLGGLALTVLCGFVLGASAALFPWIGNLLTPYTVLFQTVPIVALAPLLIIWLGFGLKSVMASSFIVSLFPMISGIHHGFRSVDRAYLDLFRIHRARFHSLVGRLLVPASLPQFFQALKVCSGLAVIGAIVGEFMSGTGLGSVIEVARVQYRVDLMFAAILLSTLWGLLLLVASSLVAHFSLRRWHASEWRE